MVCRAVFPSAVWAAETWTASVAMSKRISSWGARVVGSVHGVRMRCGELVGDFWRRLHRTGHRVANRLHLDLASLRRLRYHSYAGHLARSVDPVMTCALRTRCLVWWRSMQHPRLPLHRPFGRPRRWEAELENFHGVEWLGDPLTTNVGWMRFAQSRASWKELSKSFSG